MSEEIDVSDVGSAGAVLSQHLTLDEDRDWIDVTCEACSAPAKIHNGPGNVTSRPTVVTATLPDGTEIQVAVDEEVPSPTLLWECGSCGQKQKETL